MTDRLRIAVAGCGNVARNTYLPALVRPALAERLDLVAVFSRTEAKARWAKETFGAREWFTDHDRLLARDDVEAVVNLTPKPLHAELGLATLEAGKHLYIEKPIAADLVGATRLIDAAARSGLKLVCAPSVPLWPATLKVKSLIDSGAIGRPCYARAHASSWGPRIAWYYMKGAGPILDLSVYPLTFLTEVLGPARRVTGFSGLSISERTMRDGSIVTIDEDDNSHMLLDFGGNVFASCDSTFVVRDCSSPFIEFYGSEGTINVCRDGLSLWVELSQVRDDVEMDGWVSSHRPRMDHVDLFALGIHELVDSIQEDREPVIGGHRARHTLDIMLSAYGSARSGCAVELSTSF